MPPRNLVLLILATTACLSMWAVRGRDLPGRRFNEVFTLVEESALDPVDGETLFRAAVNGVVSKLDEHSAYLHGAERMHLEGLLDQQFGGVGLELAIDERSGEVVVVAPLVDGPAWRAGIAAGDRITAIDGGATRGVPLADIVAALRGRAGETVTLRVAAAAAPGTLDPAAADQPGTARDVPLVRDVVRVESVLGDHRRADGSWHWLLEGESRVALIRITSFGERTAAELDAALAASAAEAAADAGPDTGLRGIVIDLRGNAGGLVSAAVEVCDRFLDEGVIVATRGRRSAATSPAAESLPAQPDFRRATPGAAAIGVPMVVLIDGLTASAAEIVAACLQDHGRATVVGSRSFGKGTVQSILPLSDGDGLLKLTTSEYLRPRGGGIHRRAHDGDDAEWGVVPDSGCEVGPTAVAVERLRLWRQRRDAPLPAGRMPPPTSGPAGAALPREADEVLARALETFAAASGARPDLRGEKETPRDADDPAAAGD